MERIYNKLVRDKIPDVIAAKEKTPVTSVLAETEYKKALEDKFYEEYQEVVEASGDERCEELADVVEVIRALAKLENRSLEDIIKLADEKRAKRGGFDDRVFLEKVIGKA